MKCPNCGESMMEGELYLYKTWMSSLIFHWGSYELYFKQDGGKPINEMDAFRGSRAHKCLECGTVVFAGVPAK